MCAVLPTLAHIQFCPVFHTLLTLFFFPFIFPPLDLVPCLHSHSSGSQQSTAMLFIGHSCYLAGDFSHFSLLHNLSDFPPVINTAPIWLGRIPLLITIYLRSQSRGKAGGWALPARQQSVAFYHLGHTGISTTRVPDLDTSLAINGFKTLAACHTGQDGRQNAHPAASMTAGASLPTLSLSLLAEHKTDKVTLLQLSQLKVTLYTKSPL